MGSDADIMYSQKLVIGDRKNTIKGYPLCIATSKMLSASCGHSQT